MFSILLDSIDKEEPQLGYQGGNSNVKIHRIVCAKLSRSCSCVWRAIVWFEWLWKPHAGLYSIILSALHKDLYDSSLPGLFMAGEMSRICYPGSQSRIWSRIWCGTWQTASRVVVFAA